MLKADDILWSLGSVAETSICEKEVILCVLIPTKARNDGFMILNFREALWKKILALLDCVLVVRHVLFGYELMNKCLTYKSLRTKNRITLGAFYCCSNIFLGNVRIVP